MDAGNIWNSLYMDQLMGTQMYGMQTDPFQAYESYADVWQASPWQYSIQPGSLYGSSMLQTWQNTGFTDTLNKALTKYTESLEDTDVVNSGKDMEVSSHKGNVLQLGCDTALVYLPEEQKLMIVQTSGTEQREKNTVIKTDGTTRRTKKTGVSQMTGIDEKGIMVNQRKARASAAYRKTQRAGQTDSLWAKKRTGT